MLETLSAVASVLFILVVFLVVIAGAFYATKFIGKKYAVQSNGSGAITILDRAYVGQDRMLVIVRVAGRVMLVGVTPNHIEKLCDLDEQNLPLFPQTAQEGNFSDLLKTVMQKATKHKEVDP